MASLFFAANGASPTTAAQVKVATGTAIKTLLQIATPSNQPIVITEWGISFDGVSSTAVPVQVELIGADVAATGGTSLTPTAFGWDQTASMCVGATNGTCFSPSAEGTITVARMFDVQNVSPTSGYVKQFPLGREPVTLVSKFIRIRVTAAATVNAYAFICWEE